MVRSYFEQGGGGNCWVIAGGAGLLDMVAMGGRHGRRGYSCQQKVLTATAS